MGTNFENNKRIAKNTLMLYIRMFIMMALSLYTSRVILQTLGVEDFGIYNVVGGLVGMFGILNSSMSSATQRYITVAIGRKEEDELKKIFSIALQIHVIIGVITVILIETAGLWFLNTKMQIPQDRMNAAFWVVQFSALASFVSIMNVPFNADIIAHEKMSAFAYISIIEAFLKLGIVFLLMALPYDKLIVYSLLLVAVQLSIRFFYMLYCHRHFPETRYVHHKDKKLMKEMVSFAGWNLFGGLAAVSFNQGLSMLLNVFFGPVVNAARGIAQQVQGTIQIFITNFQTALNPQIIKDYAKQDFGQMHLLMERSSRFSFFLMLFLSLPVLFETPYILHLWLGVVPDNTVVFIRIIIATNLIYTIINPILTANSATGEVKTYYIVCGSLLISILPISYVALKLGAPAYSVFIVHFCVESVTQVVRLFLVRDRLRLSIRKYVKRVYLPILVVTISSTILPYAIWIKSVSGFPRLVIMTAVCFLSVILSTAIFGLTSSERIFFWNKFKSIIDRVR